MKNSGWNRFYFSDMLGSSVGGLSGRCSSSSELRFTAWVASNLDGLKKMASLAQIDLRIAFLAVWFATNFLALDRSQAVEVNPEAPSTTGKTGLENDALLPWQQRLEADLAYLCSDQLQGRSVTDESIYVAANYIAERFQETGLDTKLFSGIPFQRVETFVGTEAGAIDNNRLRFRRARGSGTSESTETVETILGESMNPLAIGVGKAKIKERVVFAGYGITAPEFGYDDYTNVDVRGAIVIVLRKEPRNADPQSRFDGTKTTSHAYFSTKVTNAMRHGAAAIIIVNDRASVAESADKLTDMIRREQRRKVQIQERLAELPPEAKNTRESLHSTLLGIDSIVTGYENDLKRVSDGVLAIGEAGDRADSSTNIPVLCLARSKLDELLKPQSRSTIDDIERQLDSQQAPFSFEVTGVEAEIDVELKSNVRLSDNVIAVLPGRGVLAEETVVIGAHYDHVGTGGYGSLAPGTIAIHNGADDNASGTSTLIACAALLKERLKAFDTHRRVVFIAFTAEERGLLGSAHYVRNPRFPLSNTVAMVNLDMVGRLRDNELMVYGTGSGDSLDQVLEQANFKHQFNLFKVASGYGPSDHQSFYEAGVPVLFFFTGLHNDYHRPSDDFERINFAGTFRITEMVCDVTSQLAIATSRPRRFETDKGVTIRRQMTAYLGVTLSNRGDHVVLSGVADGGPAATGGLEVGDRIDRIGKSSIRTATDILELLRTRSPGETLDVLLIRGNQRLEKRVRLQARPDG